LFWLHRVASFARRRKTLYGARVTPVNSTTMVIVLKRLDFSSTAIILRDILFRFAPIIRLYVYYFTFFPPVYSALLLLFFPAFSAFSAFFLSFFFFFLFLFFFLLLFLFFFLLLLML
jgi:hypothetical protein